MNSKFGELKEDISNVKKDIVLYLQNTRHCLECTEIRIESEVQELRNFIDAKESASY